MLIYDAKSPAPRCLRMFLLEKELVLPAVTVDVFSGENRQPRFLAINPAVQTPALRCDDGTTLSEAVAIAEYLEGVARVLARRISGFMSGWISR